MAIITDTSGNRPINAPATDRPLASPNQISTGVPNGVVTPAYAGEIYLDTATGVKYRAAESGDANSWYMITDLT